jgi:hypothetical protein
LIKFYFISDCEFLFKGLFAQRNMKRNWPLSEKWMTSQNIETEIKNFVGLDFNCGKSLQIQNEMVI